MSRSRRKTNIVGTTCVSSEKFDKRLLHGKLRSKVRQLLHNEQYDIMPEYNEVLNVWAMGKDGRMLVDKDSKWMRK